MIEGAYLAVGGADAQTWGSMKYVDSTQVLLLSWGPNGHIHQFVSIHIAQHCQGCPKTAPGVALFPLENFFTLPPSPLIKKIVSASTPAALSPHPCIPGLSVTHPPWQGAHRHLSSSGLLIVMGGPNENQVCAVISVHIHRAEGGPKIGANLKEKRSDLHISFHLNQNMGIFSLSNKSKSGQGFIIIK